MIALLLVVFMVHGHVATEYVKVKDMETCWRIVQEHVVDHIPDGATVTCLEVRDRDVT